MLFKLDTLKKIKSGEVTLAFRKWKRPTVVEGGSLKTQVGILQIKKVSRIAPDDIKQAEIKKAGYRSLDEIQKYFQSKKEGIIYKIEFELLGPDPRIELRNQEKLSAEELQEIQQKLERMDRSKKYGAWTSRVLKIIQKHPETRAAWLAEELGFEKQDLKTYIRKLKNLGLTISLSTGYRISPRGLAYLNRQD